MICARCGTEHNDPEKICPRCFYGRPKQKPKVPKWEVWLVSCLSGAIVVGVASVFIVSAVQKSISQRWIDGTWENEDMALIIQKDERRFHLINGPNVLYGKYRLEEGVLRLISDEGKHYLYYYELADENTLNISFTDGQHLIRETLIKLQYMDE